MSTTVRGMPHLSIPATQNTAPVYEFRCLFTHDVRKKAKKWHDGYVKFHTFNHRIMAYDESRNFLGDTYWKEGHEMREGDELTLDKGVMVQVEEAIEVTRTDLTPLLKKKDSPKHQNAPSSSRTLPRPFPGPATPATPLSRAATALPRGNGHILHKSLNALLGGFNRAPIGKAIQPKSPFEARMERAEKGNSWEEGRPAKRQKTADPSDAQKPVTAPAARRNHGPLPKAAEKPKAPTPLLSDYSNVQIGSVVEGKTRPDPPRPLRGLKVNSSKTTQIPPSSEVITIDSDPENQFSDVTLPDTPLRDGATVRDGLSRPKLPKGKISFPGSKSRTPQRQLDRSSPPVSDSNRVNNVDIALQLEDKPGKQSSSPKSSKRDPRAKTLHLSRGKSRGGTLLCQVLPNKKTKERSASKGNHESKRRKQVANHDRDGENRSALAGGDQQRAESMSTSFGQISERLPAARTGRQFSSPGPVRQSEGKSSNVIEDMELAYGRLDQRLLVSNPKDQRATNNPARSRSPARDSPNLPVARASAGPTDEPIPPRVPQFETAGSRSPPSLRSVKPTSLRAHKLSPLRLRHPGNSKTPTAVDPIEDICTPLPEILSTSPRGSFRRIRSANDAPIPPQPDDPASITPDQSNLTAGLTKTNPNTKVNTRPDPRRKFQRTKSLNCAMRKESNDRPTLQLPPEPEPDTDVGPWSTEAFDLLDWKPPGREAPKGWEETGKGTSLGADKPGDSPSLGGSLQRGGGFAYGRFRRSTVEQRI